MRRLASARNRSGSCLCPPGVVGVVRAEVAERGADASSIQTLGLLFRAHDVCGPVASVRSLVGTRLSMHRHLESEGRIVKFDSGSALGHRCTRGFFFDWSRADEWKGLEGRVKCRVSVGLRDVGRRRSVPRREVLSRSPHDSRRSGVWQRRIVRIDSESTPGCRCAGHFFFCHDMTRVDDSKGIVGHRPTEPFDGAEEGTRQTGRYSTWKA